MEVPLVLIGPPAAGKGTIAQFLSEVYECKIIAPGDIYKILREENSDLGRLVKDSLQNGGICPSTLTNKIIKEETDKISKDSKIILDGYPRDLEQLEFLINNFNVNLFLHIESDFVTMQLAAENRRICVNCNKTLSLNKINTHCGCVPSNQWKIRFDDSPEFYQKRFDTYQNVTAPIIDKIANYNFNYVKFDALNNDNMFEKIYQEINMFFDKPNLYNLHKALSIRSF